VPDHRGLLRRWVAELPSAAWLAVQVPGNFDAPSHTLVRQLATTSEWAPELAETVLREDDAVDDPSEYAELLAAAGCAVDAWETTYVQRLTGQDAVLEWITGTALRPVKAALEPAAWTRFRGQLAPQVNAAARPGSSSAECSSSEGPHEAQGRRWAAPLPPRFSLILARAIPAAP
jgi:trans-aconitate 2-methyltransferase